MYNDTERAAAPRRGAPVGFLDHPVYLSLLAGVGLAVAIVATMFSWIAAALGGLLFVLAASRWTWTMRDDLTSMITDADRPGDDDTRR